MICNCSIPISFCSCDHNPWTYISLERSLDEEERAGCFAFIVLWVSYYYECHVALSRGVVGWSAVRDCNSY